MLQLDARARASVGRSSAAASRSRADLARRRACAPRVAEVVDGRRRRPSRRPGSSWRSCWSDGAAARREAGGQRAAATRARDAGIVGSVSIDSRRIDGRPDRARRPSRAAATRRRSRCAWTVQRQRLFEAAAAVFARRRLRRGQRRGDQPRGRHVEGDVLRALRQQGGVHPRAVRRGRDRASCAAMAAAPRAGRRADSEERVRAGVARVPADARASYPERRRRCSSRSSAPGPRAAERRDEILEAFAESATRERAHAPSATARRASPRPTTPSRSSARSSSSPRASCASARPRDMRELEPVIERLILGLLAQVTSARALS